MIAMTIEADALNVIKFLPKVTFKNLQNLLNLLIIIFDKIIIHCELKLCY